MSSPSEQRQTLRVPVQRHTRIRLTMQGTPRDLLDIGEQGIGVRIDLPNDYHLGQRLTGIHLELPGRDHRFDGVVAHISRNINGLVLGVRLELRTIEAYRFIAELKQQCVQEWEDDANG